MKDSERQLRKRIGRLSAPEERQAEERAWRVVRAARVGAEPAAERRGRARRRAAQLAAGLALLVLVVSPAGASVRHWVADRVDPGVEHAKPALTSLPANGSLLVQSAQGPWIVHPDGAKRLLGDYAESAWSPHGLFVAATTRHQLAALEPDGTVRWTLARSGPVRLPSWNGPDGFRIAYLDGNSLRVVDGDGAGDRLLAPRVAPVAAAWEPGPEHVLAFARPDGRVEALGVDDGTRRFTTAAGARPLALQWSGGRLMVPRPGEVELLDGSGAVRWRYAVPPGSRITAARLAPDGKRVAAILSRHGRSSLLLLGPGAAPRTLFAGPGRFAGVEWSPRGRWLLLAWRSADQWLFLSPGSSPAKLDAVANVAAQFAPGVSGPAPAPFPAVSGWCCSG